MRANVRVVFALTLACFFASGVAGLVYQVAWARYLALFLGHSSYAVVAVLVAFMGGLAIGNALLGAVADRAEKPLALYAWLEIGIAVYALAFPSYYEVCHNFYISAARHFPDGGAPILLLKFAFSFLTIVLPTTLMGATFPALTKFVTLSLAELREKVAALYFINSLGAVGGCLVADFWWIPSWGLEFTMYGASALNFIAGFIALAMSRAILEGTPTAARNAPAAKPAESFSANELTIATIAIGCSGFVAMLYEVAWTRLLALALGSSTHAFSIMLITFISGIAVGAAIIARWRSLRRTLDAFGWAEAALAATLFVSMFAYELLPFWFARLAATLAHRPEVYPLYELTQGAICFLVMFLPAVCLGTTLPLASRIATAELARTGRSVGRIFAVNTLGTVLGAAVTGLWFMPAFGLATTFAIGFVLNAAIAAAILGRNFLAERRGPIIAAGVVAAAILVLAAGAFFEPRWQRTFTEGVWRIRDYRMSLKEFEAAGKRYNFRYYKDGPGATVAVHTVDGNSNYVVLRVNGKTDASSGDAGTQLMLGHIPALLRPAATNTLIVGLGSGMTAGAVLRHTNILQARVIELSPQVAEAARRFGPSNDGVMENPRLKLTIEDAKSFMKTTDQKFDIIISEPSNPWMAGVAAVFSKEFYESCRARLATNGLMVQWVQIYETSDETFQTVIKTLSETFPFIRLWRAQSGDLIMTATLQPQTVDLDAMLKHMSEPRLMQDLARAGISEPLALFSRELMSDQNTAFLARPENVVHSDYYPTLEYMSQLGFFVGAGTTLYESFDESHSPRTTTLLGDYLKKFPLRDADFRRASRASIDGQFTDQALIMSLMLNWAEKTTDSTLPLEMIERLGNARPVAVTEELRLLPKHNWLLEQARTDIATLQFYERVLMRAYRAKCSALYLPNTSKLEEVLAVLLERDPQNRRIYNLHLAELAWDKGDDDASVRFAIVGFDPDIKKSGPMTFMLDEQAPRQVLCNMIDLNLRKGQFGQAKNLAQQARNQGYLQPGELFFPKLDFMCRKVDALAAR
jgi:spermidine synthase